MRKIFISLFLAGTVSVGGLRSDAEANEGGLALGTGVVSPAASVRIQLNPAAAFDLGTLLHTGARYDVVGGGPLAGVGVTRANPSSAWVFGGGGEWNVLTQNPEVGFGLGFRPMTAHALGASASVRKTSSGKQLSFGIFEHSVWSAGLETAFSVSNVSGGLETADVSGGILLNSLIGAGSRFEFDLTYLFSAADLHLSPAVFVPIYSGFGALVGAEVPLNASRGYVSTAGLSYEAPSWSLSLRGSTRINADLAFAYRY